MDEFPELRADIPAREPDAVLLGQLVELSAASTAAAAARSPLRPARALATGAAALGLVAATTWIAGALPGVPSPISPHPTPSHAPTKPAPSHSGDARVPGADVAPTSGASLPQSEASGVASPGSSPSWTPPGKPSTPPAGEGGRAVGHGAGKHPDPGKHLGQHKPGRSEPGTRSKGKQRPPSSSPRPGRGAEPPTSAPTTGP
jgi:hypothetical protein